MTGLRELHDHRDFLSNDCEGLESSRIVAARTALARLRPVRVPCGGDLRAVVHR